MVAGIALGPSLLGWLAPGVAAFLFPPELTPVLSCLAELGLALYMFGVGLEFDFELLRSRARGAAAVSLAGVAGPATLGTVLALWLARDERLFSAGLQPQHAALFVAISMSITAFPMLARIVGEQGIGRTPLGTIALASGALDDAIAWCLLAVLLSTLSGDLTIALIAVAGTGTYALVTLGVIRAALAAIGRRADRDGGVRLLSTALMALLIGAAFTSAVRMHAVLGAFVMGLALPRGELAERLQSKLSPVTLHLLLPVFFVCSGLNTKLGLVTSPHMFGVFAAVMAAAVLGKMGACYLGARLGGQSHDDALSLGVLMNTRGLMELIILNIGLERGLIQPALFTVLVMMAVVTTAMTTPLFEFLQSRRLAKECPVRPALLD